jgi:photosystem II stability/assembly factor-like uncharacterized protein
VKKRAILLVAINILIHCDLHAQWIQDTLLYHNDGSWAMVTLHDTLYVSSHATILRSTNEGNSWQESGKGLISGETYLPFLGAGNFMLAQVSGIGLPEDTNFGKLFRSTDAGASWVRVNIPAFSIGNGLLTSIDTEFFVSGVKGLLSSSDSGVSWTVATSDSNSGLLSGSHVNCVLRLGTRLLVGSDTGIFVTMDSGQSWNMLQSTDTLREVHTLISHGPYIFAAANDSIFRSSDSGQTWLDISDHPLVSWPTYSFGIADSNLLFCNGYLSVLYRSSDNGNSWLPFGQGLGNQAVSGAFYSSQNFLYFNSYGASLYRRPLSDFGISSVAQPPASTKPEIQIYPNPFSQSTQITFTSQSAGYAEVTIVNMLGVEVARLFSGELGAGEHSFTWDAGKDACTTGTYECLVRMNGQVETLPVVLMR